MFKERDINWINKSINTDSNFSDIDMNIRSDRRWTSLSHSRLETPTISLAVGKVVGWWYPCMVTSIPMYLELYFRSCWLIKTHILKLSPCRSFWRQRFYHILRPYLDRLLTLMRWNRRVNLRCCTCWNCRGWTTHEQGHMTSTCTHACPNISTLHAQSINTHQPITSLLMYYPYIQLTLTQ